MNKKKEVTMRIGLLCLGLFLAVVIQGQVVEAFSWGTTMAKSPKVTQVDANNPPKIDSSAINIGLVGTDNVLELYNSNGVLKQTNPLYKSSSTSFQVGESARITKSGIYNGRYVDLYIKNVGLVNGATISVLSSGTVSFYRANTTEAVSYINYLNLTIVDHETGEPLPNNAFYLPAYTSSIGYSYGQYVKGYDGALTNTFYISSGDTFLKNSTAIDTTSSTAYSYMSSSGSSSQGQGSFTVYGNTGPTGYRLGSYSSSSSATALHFFQPSAQSILPVDYSPLMIPSTAKGSNNGKQMELVMKQPLNKQSLENYIPVEDSFKLSIIEENTSFLDMKKDDFSLFMDNVEVPNDGNSYTLDVVQSEGTSTINVTLKTAYLKEVNASMAANTLSKNLEIRQVSEVKNNEKDVKDSLKETEFIIPTSASLSYSLKIDATDSTEKSIITPNQDITLALEPELTADIVSNPLVLKGTRVGDIPMSSVINNPRNDFYTWDIVTASYANPETVLNTLGDQVIDINLRSTTFGNTTSIKAIVKVQNSFSLSYDANGGQGTPPPTTTFTLTGTTIANNEGVSKKDYRFVGWSTVKEPIIGTDKIYQPGEKYGTLSNEAKDTTLYAVWELDTTLYTSWDKDNSKKEISKDVDRSNTALSLPFYWKTSGDSTEYSINVRSGDTIIHTQTIKNTEPNQQLTEAVLQIPVDKLTSYGENELVVDFYQLDVEGEVINSSAPNDTLELMINIIGSLKIASVPDTLEWTQRTSRDTKGVLNRDTDNIMAVEVLDSRNIENTERNWYVQATTTYSETTPFDLVWREDLNSTIQTMKDNPIKVMDTNSAEKNTPYGYSNTWGNNLGVLLNSEDYLKVGSYKNKVVVNWNLYDVMNP